MKIKINGNYIPHFHTLSLYFSLSLFTLSFSLILPHIVFTTYFVSACRCILGFYFTLISDCILFLVFILNFHNTFPFIRYIILHQLAHSCSLMLSRSLSLSIFLSFSCFRSYVFSFLRSFLIHSFLSLSYFCYSLTYLISTRRFTHFLIHSLSLPLSPLLPISPSHFHAFSLTLSPSLTLLSITQFPIITMPIYSSVKVSINRRYGTVIMKS